MNQYQPANGSYTCLHSSTPHEHYAIASSSSFSQPPQLKRQEAQISIQVPTINIIVQDNDVLMGRGGKNNLHSGNERLRQMARAKAVQYGSADKKEKSMMSIELVSQIHALTPPGRFLKRDPVTLEWQLVPVELAREKASQCLRDAVSKGKSRKRSSSSSSSSSSSTNSGESGNTHSSWNEATNTSQKRRRTQESSSIYKDESRNTIVPIPSVVGVLDRPTTIPSGTNNQLDCPAGLTVVSHAAKDSYPRFDFELFDAESLLGDDSLDLGLDVSDFAFLNSTVP